MIPTLLPIPTFTAPPATLRDRHAPRSQLMYISPVHEAHESSRGVRTLGALRTAARAMLRPGDVRRAVGMAASSAPDSVLSWSGRVGKTGADRKPAPVFTA